MKCSSNSYKCAGNRQQKRKHQIDEGSGEDVVLTPREKLKVEVFFTIIDQLCMALRSHLDAY